jgi:hypothetical protein
MPAENRTITHCTLDAAGDCTKNNPVAIKSDLKKLSEKFSREKEFVSSAASTARAASGKRPGAVRGFGISSVT